MTTDLYTYTACDFSEGGELSHHGVKGMRWYQHIFGKESGSSKSKSSSNGSDLTRKKISNIKNAEKVQLRKIKEEGKAKQKIDKVHAKSEAKLNKAREKYGLKEKTQDETKKKISDMTDDEIRQKINRIQLEKQLKGLQEKKKEGKGFIKRFKDDAVKPALVDSGKDLMTRWLKKNGAEFLGLNEKKVTNELDSLKKEADKWLRASQISTYKKTIRENNEAERKFIQEKAEERREKLSTKLKEKNSKYVSEKYGDSDTTVSNDSSKKESKAKNKKNNTQNYSYKNEQDAYVNNWIQNLNSYNKPASSVVRTYKSEQEDYVNNWIKRLNM